jgi:large subunit ribosomal protein L12
MEYVYTAMLLHTTGQPISEENITSVLKAAGVKPDATKVKAMVASLDGVNIKEVLAQAAVAPVAAAPAAAAPAGKEDKKKEEKKEEKAVSEEEAAAGLSALFG